MEEVLKLLKDPTEDEDEAADEDAEDTTSLKMRVKVLEGLVAALSKEIQELKKAARQPIQPQTKQVAVIAGSPLSRAEFEELGTEELIKYLASQKVVLDADEQAIFRNQKIDGDAFLGLTVEILISCGVPVGVASKIIRRIPQ